MWDADKQRQLDDLRRQAQRKVLTDDEQQLLDHLLLELEHVEGTTLRPALDRQRQEQERLQTNVMQLHTQNAVLTAVAERYDDLLARPDATGWTGAGT